MAHTEPLNVSASYSALASLQYLPDIQSWYAWSEFSSTSIGLTELHVLYSLIQLLVFTALIKSAYLQFYKQTITGKSASGLRKYFDKKERNKQKRNPIARKKLAIYHIIFRLSISPQKALKSTTAQISLLFSTTPHTPFCQEVLKVNTLSSLMAPGFGNSCQILNTTVLT